MNPLNYEIKMTIKNLGKMQGPEKGNTPSEKNSLHFGTEQAN